MRFRENAENLHKPRRSSLVGVLLLPVEGEDRFSAWSPLTAHQNAAPGELACGRGMDNAAVSGSKAGGARTDTMDVNSADLGAQLSEFAAGGSQRKRSAPEMLEATSGQQEGMSSAVFKASCSSVRSKVEHRLTNNSTNVTKHAIRLTTLLRAKLFE